MNSAWTSPDSYYYINYYNIGTSFNYKCLYADVLGWILQNIDNLGNADAKTSDIDIDLGGNSGTQARNISANSDKNGINLGAAISALGASATLSTWLNALTSL